VYQHKNSKDALPYSLNSLDFGLSNEIVPSLHITEPYVMQACNQHSFKIDTAGSVQPKNCSIVTRPFSS